MHWGGGRKRGTLMDLYNTYHLNIEFPATPKPFNMGDGGFCFNNNFFKVNIFLLGNTPIT